MKLSKPLKQTLAELADIIMNLNSKFYYFTKHSLNGDTVTDTFYTNNFLVNILVFKLR